MLQLYKILFFFMLPLQGLAQDKNDELINWSPSVKLVWADYKASPDPTSDAAASTTTLLGIEYSMKNNEFSFKITCSFSKKRSWGLHKTPYILSHEQGHFDIAEIFARKLNKEVSAYVFNKKTFEKDLGKIYQSLMKDKEEMQNKYDKETNHSIKKDEQAKWLKKIDSMLTEYEEYAGYNN